jgi:S-DNA-T family DNA segregation ATPase FtsK/SpoIIIE
MASKNHLHVFLCHATDDKKLVRKLYEKLINDGIDVWFDEEKLLPGQDWDIEIQKAVRQSDVVIVCLSKKSVTKEGYVQKEIKIALDVADEKPEGTIYLIPTRLEECNVPFRLNRWQWIDLFSTEATVDLKSYGKLLKSLEFRAEQINTKLQEVEKNSAKEFIPNEQAFMLPRAWIYPIPGDILNKAIEPNIESEYYIQYEARKIEDGLASLDAPAQVVVIYRGPRFIQFGLEPLFKVVDDKRVKVRVDEIISAISDLALSLGQSMGFQAPILGQGYIGILIQREKPLNVYLLDILESDEFYRHQRLLTIALGRDVTGKPILLDLPVAPNVLIAGKPGSGLSTCLFGLVSSLLINYSPNDLRLLFIDTRKVEFAFFRDIPHLVSDMVTDELASTSVFEWLLKEAEERKRLFVKLQVRNLVEYNERAPFEEKIPFYVVFIGELSDLMFSESKQKLETMISRLAGLARTVGIHLVIATQRPSEEIITSLIKGNISNCIALTTRSEIDSINVINQNGAEKLLGRGDMLLSRPQHDSPTRLQGTFVAENEIENLVEFWRKQVI